MKNLNVLAIAALLLGAVNLQAQSVDLIPKAGINIATQNVRGISNEKSRVGFQGGVGVDIHTNLTGFSIMPELNFIQKGVSLRPSGNRKENLTLNYLELPVLAKYSFGPVYVNAGPSLGLRLGESNKVKAAYGKTKDLDFGIQMGLGVAIPAGAGKIIVDGRYNLGLSNISDNSNIKNRGVLVSLGYAIPLGS